MDAGRKRFFCQILRASSRGRFVCIRMHWNANVSVMYVFHFILEPMHSPVPRAQARISIFFNGVYCCFIFIITVEVEVCILIDTSDSLVYVVFISSNKLFC